MAKAKEYRNHVLYHDVFDGCCLFEVLSGWPDSEKDVFGSTCRPILGTALIKRLGSRNVTLVTLTDAQSTIPENIKALKKWRFHAITPRLRNPSSGNWITMFARVGSKVRIDGATKADKAFKSLFRKAK